MLLQLEKHIRLKISLIQVGKGLNEKLINNRDKKTIIKINPKFFRPAEVNILIGNPEKAKKELNWEPKTNINQLIKIMIDEEIKYYQSL